MVSRKLYPKQQRWFAYFCARTSHVRLYADLCLSDRDMCECKNISRTLLLYGTVSNSLDTVLSMDILQGLKKVNAEVRGNGMKGDC
jgi:hypothetical protein